MKYRKNFIPYFLKKNSFLILSAIALIIPDFLVRSVIPARIFAEPFNSVIPLLFTVCWASLIIYICRKLPLKAGRFIYLIIGLVAIILAFSNFIYYKIFGQFFWLSSIGLAGEAGGYIEYAIGYMTLPLLITSLADIALLIFITVKWKKPKQKSMLWISIAKPATPILIITILHVLLQPSVAGVLEDDWDSWSKPQVVYKQFTDVNKSISVSGLYQFVARDFWKTWFPTVQYEEAKYAEVDAYFEARPIPQDNEYTDIFKGKNIIAVMMESMDEWLIDEKYTPTISYMMENGINFSDYYAPTVGTGYTFNSEFAFNTGYYTPKSSVTAVNFSSNSFPNSLAHLFKNKGYCVNSFHYNGSEFYNRGIMHKSFGFEKYHSFMDYDIPSHAAQADSNIVQNDAIYADMIKSQPFFDFVVTYSAHIPYTYDDAKLALAKQNHPDLIDPDMDKETNNLLILARDTDDFFRQLLTRLDEDDLLENTVIVGFADHYAYGFSDEKKLMEYSDGLLMKVPAFIYSPSLTHNEVSKPMDTIDWMPTLINMFGLESDNCYIGQDIFDTRHDGFVHFEQALWYDGETYYMPDKTEITSENEKYIKEQSELAKKLIHINDIVVSGNYFGQR